MRRAISVFYAIAGLTGSLLLGPARSGAEENDGSVAFTDMDQLLFDARQAFRQGRYDVAIHTCEKMTQKDPNNMTAFKIMGSAYALMDEPGRARRVFEYALTIDPNDSDIPKFLSRLPKPSDH